MSVTQELFQEAHAQLLERDQELILLARRFVELVASSGVDESHPGLSALRGIQHDRLVVELRAQLAEQAEWAKRSAEEVAKRDEIIRELQASLAEQSAWAQRSAGEVVIRDEIILQLRLESTLKYKLTHWLRRR